jgi:hypothetical protein
MRILAPLILAAALAVTSASLSPALAQVGPNFLAVPSDDEPTMTELDMWFERLSHAETKARQRSPRPISSRSGCNRAATRSTC